MAKKKKKAAPKIKSEPNVRWLLNTPPSLRDWATEQAERQGISRDAFMRILLRTSKAAMSEQTPEAQAELFEDLKGTFTEVVERVVSEAVKKQPEQVVRRRLGGRKA